MATTAHFDNIQFQILSELKMATKSVYIVVAWFTDKTLFDALLSKQKEGIKVSIMLLDDTINTNPLALNFGLIAKNGGVIAFAPSREELMHNKFCVIDCDTVITGSYNWTNKAKSNDENIMVSKNNESLADSYTKEFYRLYKKHIYGDIFRNLGNKRKRIESFSEFLIPDKNIKPQDYNITYDIDLERTLISFNYLDENDNENVFWTSTDLLLESNNKEGIFKELISSTKISLYEYYHLENGKTLNEPLYVWDVDFDSKTEMAKQNRLLQEHTEYQDAYFENKYWDYMTRNKR